MTTITQAQALRTESLAGGERAHFWRATNHDGMACLHARFTRHRYAVHTHATWVLGVIVAGAEAYTCQGRSYVAGPGQVCVVPPGAPHDGAPHEEGYVYRMFYPSEGLMRAAAAEIGRGSSTPFFQDALIDDPDLFARVETAHRAFEAAGSRLAADEALLDALKHLFARHAGVPSAAARDEPRRVALVKARLEAGLADDVGLDDLAALAGCNRYHLVRAFKRATGMTPHAYLIDARVRAARRLLGSGQPPASVADATGFADQSHLTRCFKARTGVTPGAYRRAMAIDG